MQSRESDQVIVVKKDRVLTEIIDRLLSQKYDQLQGPKYVVFRTELPKSNVADHSPLFKRRELRLRQKRHNLSLCVKRSEGLV